jgi:tetratricopeptide (TPR) repeat protein
MRVHNPGRDLGETTMKAIVLAVLAASIASAIENQQQTTPGGRRPDDSVQGVRGGESRDKSANVPDALEKIRNLIVKAHYAEAEGNARALLTETEARSGHESAEVAEVLDLLVEALFRGKEASSPETQALAERAVVIKEKILGPDGLALSQSLNNLARVTYLNGDFAKSIQLADRSLAIREKALGPSHPDVAQSLNTLAVLHRDTGDFGAARKLCERALSIRETSLGPDAPAVGESVDVLGSVLMNTGEYAEARSLNERAVAIREEGPGARSPGCSQEPKQSRERPGYFRGFGPSATALRAGAGHMGEVLRARSPISGGRFRQPWCSVG